MSCQALRGGVRRACGNREGGSIALLRGRDHATASSSSSSSSSSSPLAGWRRAAAATSPSSCRQLHMGRSAAASEAWGSRVRIAASPRPRLTATGVPMATDSRSCGFLVPGQGGLASLRRWFSFGPRCLDREGKDAREQPPPPTSTSTNLSSPSPVETSSIGKALPKSIGASITPHENIYTVPNLLTFSRLIAAPFVGYAILHDAHTWALGLFVYAGVSDLLDGWIARRWNLQTVVGSVVDPMADKILMTILTVCLATKGLLPVWLAVIILGRDVGLAISAIYYRYISLPPPKTFTRYWDFSLPSAEVRPTTISKYNTFLQLALMGLTTTAPVLTGVELGPALVGLQYIVATTTIWSGLSYVFSKDAVKILSDAKEKKEQAAGKDGKPKSS